MGRIEIPINYFNWENKNGPAVIRTRVYKNAQHLDLAVLVGDALPALAVVRVLHNELGDELARPGAALRGDRVHLEAAAQVGGQELGVGALFGTPDRVPCAQNVSKARDPLESKTEM